MSKKEVKKLVPKLRFPQFKNSWEYRTLGIYLEEYSEKVPPNTELPVYSSTRIGLKPQKDYYDGRQIINEGEYGIVPKGYFVYRHMSDDSVFKFNINETDNDIAVSKEYPVFKTINLNSRFLLYKLNDSDDFKVFAEKQKKGGTRTRLYFNTLCSWETLIPTPKEQKQIGDCLFFLDNLITAESEKLRKLKAFKIGLTQQLFPAEGETVPKLRFPEFAKTEGWTYLSGDKVFDQISNTNHNSDLPILAITQDYGAIPREKIDYNVIVTDKSVESYKVVDIGDFIISLRSFQGGIEYSRYKGICSPAYIILRKKNNAVDDFFKQYFKTSIFIRHLNKNIEGIRDGKMVSYKQFSDLLLPFPDPDEQQKIANCFFSLDELITAQTEKTEALKTHKKGLTQQLFPNVNDEVR